MKKTSHLFLYVAAIWTLLIGVGFFAPQVHAATVYSNAYEGDAIQTGSSVSSQDRYRIVAPASFTHATGVGGTINVGTYDRFSVKILSTSDANCSDYTSIFLLAWAGGSTNAFVSGTDMGGGYCEVVLPAPQTTFTRLTFIPTNVSNTADFQLAGNLDAPGELWNGTAFLDDDYIDGTIAFELCNGACDLNYFEYVEPDGVDTTHVIRINDPAPFIIASSTFDVSFDIHTPAGTEANAYRIEYINSLTRQTTVQMEYLVDAGWNSAFRDFNVSTSSTVSNDGTQKMSVQLIQGFTRGVEGGPGPIDEYYIVGPRFDGRTFSVNVEDNVTTTVFEGLQTGQFASTTCNVNFLGNDFNLSGCVGYMVQPSAATMQKMTELTLNGRFPFAYAYDIGQMRNELFDNPGTGTTSISVSVPGFGTITFLSAAMIAAVPYAGTIKTILIALMWLLTAELIYLAILRSHNTNTGV